MVYSSYLFKCMAVIARFRSDFYSLCRCRLQLKHQQLRHYLQVPSDVEKGGLQMGGIRLGPTRLG